MDRQTLRDWVIRFNEQGPDGLINIPSPGMPPKLNSRHKAFLARIVEEGPIPAIHGVVLSNCLTSAARCGGYSVVLDPEPSPNCQQPHPSI